MPLDWINMPRNHVCLRCCTDSGWSAPRREPHYGLLLSTCNACGSAEIVRPGRHHPLVRGWRTARKAVWTLRALAFRFVCLAVLTTGLAVCGSALSQQLRSTGYAPSMLVEPPPPPPTAANSADPSRHVKDASPWWYGPNAFLSFSGGCIVLATGAWITVALRHRSFFRNWLPLGGVVALAHLSPRLFETVLSLFSRTDEWPQPFVGMSWQDSLDFAGATGLLIMLTPLGCPIGWLFQRGASDWRTQRFRAQRIAIRKRRNSGS